jgi:thioredoxin reductase
VGLDGINYTARHRHHSLDSLATFADGNSERVQNADAKLALAGQFSFTTDSKCFMKISAVILAAGYGTRMKSELPKVMHPLLGRPLVDWAVRAAAPLVAAPPIVVVGHGQELVRAFLGSRAVYAEQQRSASVAAA